MSTRAAHRSLAVLFLFLLMCASCASVEVSDRERYEGERLPRPDRILVYDFAATPGDIPAWSDAHGRYAEPATPPSEKEREAGRKLGAHIAEELVTEIQEMGLPAEHAGRGSAPEVGDIAFTGYLVSVDEGSRLKRLAIGFGSGSADLKTQVEAYRMTDMGLQKLGSGATDAGGGGKMPGLVVPLAVVVATANPIGLVVGGAVKGAGEVTGRSTIEGTAERTAKKIGEELRVAFQKQGWIEE